MGCMHALWPFYSNILFFHCCALHPHSFLFFSWTLPVLMQKSGVLLLPWLDRFEITMVDPSIQVASSTFHEANCLHFVRLTTGSTLHMVSCHVRQSSPQPWTTWIASWNLPPTWSDMPWLWPTLLSGKFCKVSRPTRVEGSTLSSEP